MDFQGAVVLQKCVVSVLSVLILVPAAIRAQTTEIASGDKIRVSAQKLGTIERIGILTKVQSDKLLLVDPGQDGKPWEIQLDRVDRIDVRRAEAGNHKHRGALIGMITGFTMLGAIGYGATHCECEFDGFGAIAAGPGAGIGALIGFFAGRSQKTEGWQRVPLPLKITAIPTRNSQVHLRTILTF